VPAHFYRATFSMQSSFFPLCAQLTFVLELFPGREESNQAFADSNVTVRLDTTTHEMAQRWWMAPYRREHTLPFEGKRPLMPQNFLQSNIPGQELTDTFVRVIGDTGDDGAEISFRIDGVDLGSFNVTSSGLEIPPDQNVSQMRSI